MYTSEKGAKYNQELFTYKKSGYATIRNLLSIIKKFSPIKKCVTYKKSGCVTMRNLLSITKNFSHIRILGAQQRLRKDIKIEC